MVPKQPLRIYGLNRANPLTRGIVGWIDANKGVPLKANTIAARSLVQPLPFGRGHIGNGSSLFTVPLTTNVTDAATLLFVGNFRRATSGVVGPAGFGHYLATGTHFMGFVGADGGTVPPRLVVRLVNLGASGEVRVAGSTVTSDYADVSAWVGVYGGSETTIKMYRDGTDVSGTLTGVISGAMDGMNNLSLGGVNRGSDINAAGGTYPQHTYLVIGWNRVLTLPEIRAVSANPWGVFVTRAPEFRYQNNNYARRLASLDGAFASSTGAGVV